MSCPTVRPTRPKMPWLMAFNKSHTSFIVYTFRNLNTYRRRIDVRWARMLTFYWWCYKCLLYRNIAYRKCLITVFIYFWSNLTVKLLKTLKHEIYLNYYYGSAALCWALDGFSVSWSYTQSVGLLRQGISPSQGLYLHTEQHKPRINSNNTDIHALSGIRTHDPSVRAGEDSSCLRPRGHCDRQFI
jgi:hypothetical protein